jgi:hypothetical protein
MLQASLIVLTSEGQRSRRSDHKAPVRHSYTLLHAIQYAAADTASCCKESNARGYEGMRYARG